MVPVTLSGMVLALGFVALLLGVSRFLGLGLGRTILVAAGRAYLQLTILGLVLVWVFSWDHPAITGAIFGLQVAFAVQAVRDRLRHVPVPVGRPVFLAVAGGGLLVTLLTTAVVLQVQPFWRARFWIPIAGMVLGHAMNGIAVAVERLFADLQGRRGEVLAFLSLGATPAEAMRPAARAAVRAGMIPVLNNLATVGVVAIRGMMTGQLLAGADPQQAARYQLVVLLMVAAASALGSTVAVLGCGRQAFDGEGALRDLSGGA